MVIGKCAEMFAKEPDSRDAQEAAECRIGVPDRPVLDYQDTDRRILGKLAVFYHIVVERIFGKFAGIDIDRRAVDSVVIHPAPRQVHPAGCTSLCFKPGLKILDLRVPVHPLPEPIQFCRDKEKRRKRHGLQLFPGKMEHIGKFPVTVLYGFCVLIEDNNTQLGILKDRTVLHFTGMEAFDQIRDNAGNTHEEVPPEW